MNEKTKVIIGQEGAELVAEFLAKIKGKSINEILPLLGQFKRRLPQGVTFTQQERDIIIEEALNGMAPDDKNRYKSFLKTMGIL